MQQNRNFDFRGVDTDAATDPMQRRALARARADHLYAERRRRDDLFPDGLFSEPAWDLMLALFIARDKGQTLILCKAYRAAGVSDTTGRRLLDRMEADGLVTRRRAPRSRKMRVVELTDEAVRRLIDYLTGMP